MFSQTQTLLEEHLVPKNILSRHHCQAAVLTCMDFRFNGEEGAALKKTFGLDRDDYDLIALPGGAQNLTDYALGADYSRASEEAIGLAVNLHQVSDIIVLSHQDCGALKAVGKTFLPGEFKSETKFHHDLLQNAIRTVRSKWPSVKIKAGFAHVVDSGDGQSIVVSEVV